MNPAVIISAIGSAIELALKLREALKQSKELTPEEEKALDEQIAKLTSKPHWKPAASVGVTEVPNVEPWTK